MAVLVSYHRLVEKDSQRINYCWKMSILVILFIAIASSLVISFSMQSLGESFSQNCVLGAKLRFINVSHSNWDQLLERINSAKERKVLYEQLRSSVENDKDIIDEYSSSWSNPDFCEYLTYTPLFHALLGVIWVALFMMHGHGGEGIGSIIAKPWTIVFPTLLFFTVCSISALVCASLTSSGLVKFCQEFDSFIPNRGSDCAQLITDFAMYYPNGWVLPDKNYYLVAWFPWIWLTSYLSGWLIMILRILLVVDFRVVRVVISTVDNVTGSEVEQQSVVFLDEHTQDAALSEIK